MRSSCKAGLREGIDNPRLRGRKQKLMILSFHANIQNTDAQADQQWLEPQETIQIRQLSSDFMSSNNIFDS